MGATEMDPVQTAVAALVRACAVGADKGAAGEAADHLLGILARGKRKKTDLDDAASTLGNALLSPTTDHFPLLASGIGALVDQGADLSLALPQLLTCVQAMATRSLAFAKACERLAANRSEYGNDGKPWSEAVAQTVADEMPNADYCWALLPYTCSPLVLILARTAAARSAARTYQPLQTACDELCRFADSPEGTSIHLLARLLRVRDGEEMVVLCPEHERGYRVVTSGVMTVAQLTVLLHGALVGDPEKGWLPGRRLDKRLLAVAGNGLLDPLLPHFEADYVLFDCQALQPNGQLSPDHRLAHLAMPCEVPDYNDERVVLLGRPHFPERWNAERPLPQLCAELAVRECLDRSAVDQRLRLLRRSESK